MSKLIRRMGCVGHVAFMVKYKILACKHEEKRICGRYKHIRKNNIKMDLQEVVCESRDWI
jgi:hypothetical protein